MAFTNLYPVSPITHMAIPEHKPITDWAIEDRPREKLLERGVASLTSAELIALLLSTGTQRASALDLARDLLAHFGDLPQMARASTSELMQLRGIGKAKAITLIAAFELGRRKLQVPAPQCKIYSAQAVANYLGPKMADLDQEVFHVLFLNRNNVIKAEKQFFKGGVSATIIDPKLIFREAVHQLCSALILAHNHPSGSLRPSQADLAITRKLVEGAQVFDIQVLDHIILSHQGYYSFADQGQL